MNMQQMGASIDITTMPISICKILDNTTVKFNVITENSPSIPNNMATIQSRRETGNSLICLNIEIKSNDWKFI